MLGKLLALLACQAVAVRYRRQGRHNSSRVYGTVDQLFTWGAPGSGSPGFVNANSPSGCYPGKRFWNAKRGWFGRRSADLIPMLAGLASYTHPKMVTVENDITDNPIETLEYTCSDASQDRPRDRSGDIVLHARTPYVYSAHTISSWMGNVTDICTMGSYQSDLEYLKGRFNAQGWKLVSSAKQNGNLLEGGPQVCHLLQDPNTLECIMTFQGTDSVQDVITDMNGGKAHFCGLVGPGETCDVFENCSPAKAGDSFVHLGFRDHLRRMLRTDGWQHDIRPKLSSCAKVFVGGHSLGGATAELFTACIARAPASGQYGYEEDFKHMFWHKGTPSKLFE